MALNCHSLFLHSRWKLIFLWMKTSAGDLMCFKICIVTSCWAGPASAFLNTDAEISCNAGIETASGAPLTLSAEPWDRGMERSCQGLPPHRAMMSWHPPTDRNTSALFIQWLKETLHLWADSCSFRRKLVQIGPLSCACAEAEHSRDQVSLVPLLSHGFACYWCQIANPCFLWGQLKGDKESK